MFCLSSTILAKQLLIAAIVFLARRAVVVDGSQKVKS